MGVCAGILVGVSVRIGISVATGTSIGAGVFAGTGVSPEEGVSRYWVLLDEDVDVGISVAVLSLVGGAIGVLVAGFTGSVSAT